jgi:hypothetical protein
MRDCLVREDGLCLRDIEMAQGPTAAAGPDLGPFSDESDDLPRTFRREKEARAREARERAAQERAAAPVLPTGAGSPEKLSARRPAIYADPDIEPATADMPFPTVVRSFDVPFFQLAAFFLKAVIAAIPALILLAAILWLAGAALQALMPSLIKMKILISFPN